MPTTTAHERVKRALKDARAEAAGTQYRTAASTETIRTVSQAFRNAMQSGIAQQDTHTYREWCAITDAARVIDRWTRTAKRVTERNEDAARISASGAQLDAMLRVIAQWDDPHSMDAATEDAYSTVRQMHDNLIRDVTERAMRRMYADAMAPTPHPDAR